MIKILRYRSREKERYRKTKIHKKKQRENIEPSKRQRPKSTKI